jgi:stearoyl-CoA desaturase (delta-9 desaturase)
MAINWKKLNWTNTLFLFTSPLAALTLVLLHYNFESDSLPLWIWAAVFYVLTGLSITAGYHRLFSHRSYRAHPIVRFFYLLFGAAAFENSALKWATDHRKHHRKVDELEDPYSIKKGFFYAHMGWICEKNEYKKYPSDLLSDPLVMWQDKHYLAISISVGIVLPTLIGFYYGSPVGGLAIIGFLRLVCVHHFTFFINSLAHKVGSQPYSLDNSAKDNLVMAFLSYGEGYHNFHHKFQQDYRNGIRFYHFDPTKWLIQSLGLFGLVRQLKKAKESDILKARIAVMETKIKQNIGEKFQHEYKVFESIGNRAIEAKKKWEELKVDYSRLKKELPRRKHQKLVELRFKMELTKQEYQNTYREWQIRCRMLHQMPALVLIDV